MTPDLNTFLDEVLDGLNTFYVEAARPYSPLDGGERQEGLKPSEAKARLTARFEEERKKTLSDLGMGAGEYHNEEYCVPLRHIVEKIRSVSKEDSTNGK